MKLSDFEYDLPSSSIAQEPVEPRDQSRLMVLDRQTGAIRHRHFHELLQELRPGDILVTNATKVFPARLRGKKSTGGKIEILLLESEINNKDQNVAMSELRWRALVRGTTRPAELLFPEGLKARMAERLQNGEWMLEFSTPNVRLYLDQYGEMPLPPYIKRAAPRASDLGRYQTVYAHKEGAVAAPTAGFHFTPELLERIHARGVIVRSVLLHVGWGTFRPVRVEKVEDHPMLPESYHVTEVVARELNQARREGRRIIAVGTTAVRTLETICDEKGTFHSGQGAATLFIYPGYRFKGVDALITNFHLPDSTPLLLACAFYASPVAPLRPPASTRDWGVIGDCGSPGLPKGEGWGEAQPKDSEPFSLRFAYDEAIREGYRFYSYGDAMFIQ